ncbi:luciferin 4-monooxygenase-like [Pectinophora gossypiella]|uniref:luciferin 4-monooxygenase-like n=1 Tax=Pectinophora gossypiella TaxID=13191 RepID=UPI00214E53BC|nr:luciferin 4-monooxygenase-like [Pectinophora gossypiella]XP_049877773.1 luciferin 4-monooxygenase-like [Pectinophora gossypiella]XP_049877774.1 luciferin 4-monooxygenase-like [Pectinophora gossypiella]XP_049877775.1 luciferin 4-monooxygenase-like [Pectinophora gossypiella]XP_049877776.1 luciferin 4-monooxygenase-like [Pectinophora gossypiella]
MNKKIIDNVVHGGPALRIPGHLNFGQHIIDKLREQCEREGKVALVNGETGHQTTYRQILQDSVNVATGLRRAGVKRGDVVAFCSENRDEYIATAIAVVCCGATFTTANLQYTKDEMIHILNISRPKLLFCSEAALKLNYKAWKSLSFIKKIIQFNGTPLEKGIVPFSSILVQASVDEFEADEVQGWTDNVFILYSSGTTGLPKGVMITHINALYGLASIEEKSPGTNEDSVSRIQTLVPWYHAYGLMSTIYYLAVGNYLVYFAGFNPVKYLQAIQEYRTNKLLAVPPIVVFLAKAPILEKFDLSSVTSIWCGAAPLSSEVIDEAMRRLPNCKGIYQAYGMTETSLSATSDTDDERVKPKPGSGGYPLPGVKVKVVDTETGQKLGPNQKGEICIKGPIIMKGYAGNKAATQAMFDREGYLKTGDVGYYDQDGCFFIVDRLKELIKYKGSQVPPAIVENVVLQHEAVADCGVVGAPDVAAGELPTAFVTLKPGAQATEHEIIEFTNQRLSPEKRLYGGVIFVKQIPKNPSGKILRRVLRQQLKNIKKSKL